MSLEPVLDIFDRSYYVDRLQKLTGKPRSIWRGYSAEFLRNLLDKEIKRRRFSALQFLKEAAHV